MNEVSTLIVHKTNRCLPKFKKVLWNVPTIGHKNNDNNQYPNYYYCADDYRNYGPLKTTYRCVATSSNSSNTLFSDSSSGSEQSSLFTDDFVQLIHVARGGGSITNNNNHNHHHQRLMKVFPLKRRNVPSITNPIISPSDFHQQLCTKIRSAKYRIYLASLYIGPSADDHRSTNNSNNNSNNKSIGGSSYPKEYEFLSALSDVITKQQSDNKQQLDIKIVLDRNRALREIPIKSTNEKSSKTTITSASACFRALHTNQYNTRSTTIDGENYNNNSTNLHSQQENQAASTDSSSGIYLFSVLPSILQKSLPNPFNEIAGVFHIKCYIIDNEMIISGANLSEEYFTDRSDRYLWFRDDDDNDNNNKQRRISDTTATPNKTDGLVQCYADMINIFCQQAERYTEVSVSSDKSSITNDKPTVVIHPPKISRTDLVHSLSNILTVPYTGYDTDQDWNRSTSSSFTMDDNDDDDGEVIAIAIPTFQFPKRYLPRYYRKNVIPKDTDSMCNFIETATKLPSLSSSLTIRIATAYLNPTQQFLYSIRNSNVTHFLSAGKLSHGFKPKKQQQTTISNNTNNTNTVANASNSSRRTDWIPSVFDRLARNAVQKLQQSNPYHMTHLWLYQRLNWTFHAKGLWLTHHQTDKNQNDSHSSNRTPSPSTTTDSELKLEDPSKIFAVTVGSGNYGGRSDGLDMESNIILVFPNKKNNENNRQYKKKNIRDCQQLFQQEWNRFTEYAVPAEQEEQLPLSRTIRMTLPLIQKFF